VLTIRKEQIEAFDKASLKAFEDEMVGHLRGFASRLAETCGEPALRVLIRLGVARAKAQGLTLRGPVRLFIELMVMFGSEFDKDPLLPWASAALDNPAVKDQMARAETLHRASLAYIETAVGPKDSYVIAALRRLDEEDIKGYDISSRNFEERAPRKLRAIYPQKCVVAGDPALLWLVRRGPILANDQGAPGDLGVVLFIVLPFLLGHAVASDPMYPWVKGALSDPQITDPGKRIERLYNRSRTYLGETLAYLEGE